eukprot:NODE_3965_length_857_cov_2.506188_g3290_i0.p5 GENE.NODE_3965_length_857_cov_2.506188_g3290_i0~~NODE_3965_length_857_cov_2.506188_g3290_i0.p5  ORF type:complete len:55 (+),score=1.58 NODE_3965_length_857_cov_2.506188_g3290_i0:473-637(+)
MIEARVCMQRASWDNASADYVGQLAREQARGLASFVSLARPSSRWHAHAPPSRA